jgi:hypothetical protein
MDIQKTRQTNAASKFHYYQWRKKLSTNMPIIRFAKMRIASSLARPTKMNTYLKEIADVY